MYDSFFCFHNFNFYFTGRYLTMIPSLFVLLLGSDGVCGIGFFFGECVIIRRNLYHLKHDCPCMHPAGEYEEIGEITIYLNEKPNIFFLQNLLTRTSTKDHIT
ncbi:hypothetical protein RF11_14820 [Thelohanellus kitauei]|uniref:Uncharacterized protein n=1 Tax=Thelohanellus kitauei TaxID=669202 RepID=A0A0C2J5U1_THEKT|nr:hypothetical protein RF11_14820 [Thelohanellus kitauei]